MCAQKRVYHDKRDRIEGEYRGEKYREVEGDSSTSCGKEAEYVFEGIVARYKPIHLFISV